MQLVLLFCFAIGLALTGIPDAFAACACNSNDCKPPVRNQCRAPCRKCTETAAKEEGKVVWYVSSALPEQTLQALRESFRKQFPFVNVESSRHGSGEILNRVFSETKSGRGTADLMTVPVSAIGALRQNGLLAELGKGLTADVRAGTFAGDQRWYSLFADIYVFAYNAALLKDPPKSYSELLRADLKGSIALDEDPAWLLGLQQALGEGKSLDLLKQFRSQQPAITANKIATAELVAARTIKVGLTFARLAVGFKERGMPIDWYPPEPVIGYPYPTGMIQNPPHPASASLFLSFLFSPEAQAEIAKAMTLPALIEVAVPPQIRELRAKKITFVPEVKPEDLAAASNTLKSVLSTK